MQKHINVASVANVQNLNSLVLNVQLVSLYFPNNTSNKFDSRCS